VAVVAALLGSALHAQNFGFKINYRLRAPNESGFGGQPAVEGGGLSLNGYNTLSLPFNARLDQANLFDIIQDIQLAAGLPPPPGAQWVVNQIARWNQDFNAWSFYTGDTGDGTQFPLLPDNGYLVQMSQSVNYTVVGTHDDDHNVGFEPDGGRGLLQVLNVYGHPPGARSTDLADLIAEVNAAAGAPAVVQMGRWKVDTDSWALYNGTSGPAGGYCLAPAEAYLVQVNTPVVFIPAMGPLDLCPPLE
jgi:hypothetical protein